ncbi:ATP-binding protein [Maricaulis sp.]|uniref:ATP-binding protein n=1 Tax=Maricaulis sp. TaxID=1486257 RepID=UPI002604CEE5|nr:ATP-binding protein [Maricaulis sp.]
MSTSPWHFPRADFARSVLTLLMDGPIQGVSLFGPRRMGKTQFLLNDLAPLAERKRHRVVYVSFMQTGAPLALTLFELDLALKHRKMGRRLTARPGELKARFSLKAPVGPGELTVDLGQSPRELPGDQLLALDALLGALADPGHPTLIMLDEFQELADSENAELVAALRTALDKRRDGLRAIFTGSSVDGLNRVFSTRSAPFFRFATPVDLPPLGEEFVAHQLKAFGEISRRKLDRAKADAVFERFERNPLIFQRWLMMLAVRPDLDEDGTLDLVRAALAEELGFEPIWLKLSPGQRIVARLLAERVEQIYGEEGRNAIAQLTAGASLQASEIQAALRRLRRLDVVDRWDKDWRISDPLIEAWVKERPAEELRL